MPPLVSHADASAWVGVRGAWEPPRLREGPDGSTTPASTTDGPPTPPPSSEWIKQLGSDREDVRAAAETALGRRGRDVLPLLRVATDSRDTAIRSRALALIARIEGTLLLSPTMVALDFQDRPLAEVVATIGR